MITREQLALLRSLYKRSRGLRQVTLSEDDHDALGEAIRALTNDCHAHPDGAEEGHRKDTQIKEVSHGEG